MPRMHLLKELFHMSYDDLKVLYQQLGTIKAIATHLDVSERAVKNWFKEGNITGMYHAVRERRFSKDSSLKKWIKEHPDVKLPRSPSKLAQITGIPIATVKSYFTRRRMRIQRWLKTFPFMGDLELVLKAVDGSYVPTKSIGTYTLKVDPYSTRLTIKGMRKTGSAFTLQLTLGQFQRLFTDKTLATPHLSEQEHPPM